MIGITVNNRALVLPPNLKIRVELNSTLFDTEEGLPASIVWYFNAPADGNEETLGYANKVEAAGKYRIVIAKLTYFGMPLFTGKLVVKSGNHKEFRLGMTIDQFTEEYQDKLITDLSWPTENIGGSPFDENNVVQFCTDVATGAKIRDYEFPQLYAPKWYGNDNANNADFTGFVNRMDVDSFKVNTDADNGNTLLPCPKMLSVLKKVYADDNFTVTGSILDDVRLQQLILLNNFPLDGLFAQYSMKASTTGTVKVSDSLIQIYCDDIASGDNKDDASCNFEGGYKAKANKTYNILIETELDGDRLSTSTSPVPIYFYLYKNGVEIANKRIDWKDAPRVDSSEFSNITPSFSIEKTDLVAGDVLKARIKINPLTPATNVTLISGSLSVSVDNKATTNTFAENINVANHLPPIGNNDFVSAMRETFGFAMFYDFQERSVEINYLKDVLKSKKYLDLTHALIKDSEDVEVQEKRNYIFSFNSSQEILNYSQYDFLGSFTSVHDLPTPENINVVAKVLNEDAIYLYKVTEENEYIWEFYTMCENKHQTGISNTVEINPNIEIPKMSDYSDKYLPEVDFQAQSKAFKQNTNPVDKIHLVFYRGLRGWHSANAMTHASTMQYVRYDDLLSPGGGLVYVGSLLWSGYKNLFETYYKDWTNFIKKSETITMNFDLDIEDILNLMILFKPQPGVPVDEQVRKIRVENTNYIPRKMSFELSMNGSTFCEAELEKPGYDSQY